MKKIALKCYVSLDVSVLLFCTIKKGKKVCKKDPKCARVYVNY